MKPAPLNEVPRFKRVYEGYYEADVAVILLRDGVTKECTAKLTVERNDEAHSSSLPWTWTIECEKNAFRAYDEDGGSATKREIAEMFGKEFLRRWHWYEQVSAWCIG